MQQRLARWETDSEAGPNALIKRRGPSARGSVITRIANGEMETRISEVLKRAVRRESEKRILRWCAAAEIGLCCLFENR